MTIRFRDPCSSYALSYQPSLTLSNILSWISTHIWHQGTSMGRSPIALAEIHLNPL